jgi:hypothetical protein
LFAASSDESESARGRRASCCSDVGGSQEKHLHLLAAAVVVVLLVYDSGNQRRRRWRGCLSECRGMHARVLYYRGLEVAVGEERQKGYDCALKRRWMQKVEHQEVDSSHEEDHRRTLTRQGEKAATACFNRETNEKRKENGDQSFTGG